MRRSCGIVIVVLAFASNAPAKILITEVHPSGSSASYAADWFELTNNGGSAVDITGWKMDDSSNAFASAVPLRNVTSIAPNQSVVFFEGNTTGTTDATITANFESSWFGANVPADFVIGAYGGSGVGLSGTGDAVHIFDSAGTPITGVIFGTATVGTTFDNAQGLENTSLSTLSTVGIAGAFVSTEGEIGSPGTVPEPASLFLMLSGAVLLPRKRR